MTVEAREVCDLDGGRVENYDGSNLPEWVVSEWKRLTFDPAREEEQKLIRDKMRLKDDKTFRDWLTSKGLGRMFYVLGDQDGGLLGLAWFARGKYLSGEPVKLWEEVADEVARYNWSYATRVYGERGKGVGTAFMRQCLQRELETQTGITGFWVSTRRENAASVAMNKHLGLRVVGEVSSEGVIYLAGSRSEVELAVATK